MELRRIRQTAVVTLVTGALLLGAWGGIAGLRPLYDSAEDEKQEAALAAVALTPTILAVSHRIHRGLAPIPADPSAGHAADYLRMVSGEVPAGRDMRAMRASCAG